MLGPCAKKRTIDATDVEYVRAAAEPERVFQGQDPDRPRSARNEKAARRTMAEFRPVVRQARESVVALYGRQGEQLALGTIVTANGYTLTKASVLGDEKKIEAEFSDGRVVEGTEVVDAIDIMIFMENPRGNPGMGRRKGAKSTTTILVVAVKGFYLTQTKQNERNKHQQVPLPRIFIRSPLRQHDCDQRVWKNSVRPSI